MEYYNNILAIESNWLLSEGILTKNNYKILSHRNDITIVRRGCRNTPALVAFDNMPERFKAKVVEKLGGNPYDMVKSNRLAELIEEDLEASKFFDEYEISEDGRHLPTEKRREYYANAIVFNAIAVMIANRRAKRSALGGKAVRFWDVIADAAQELDRTRYPHSLPANARRLESKFKLYKDGGYATLVHKGYTNNNRNAARVKSEEQMSTLLTLLSLPNNFDDTEIARKYNLMAAAWGWDTVTASTVANYRDKYADVIYPRRRGAKAYHNNKSMQVKRSAPVYPMQMWTLDGWKAELLYQHRDTNKKGHSVTTYTNSPTIVVVLDPCMKYPIGYAIGTHETPELIKEAIRNAMKHTAELFGEMYEVLQLQSDNYAIGKLSDLYSSVANKVTPAAVGNAKSKIIERWFGQFNDKYCKNNINWSGYGVTSRKELQPNGEYLSKFKHQFPDFEGVCQQLTSYIEAEREALRDKYLAAWSLTPIDRKRAYSYERYLFNFGCTNGHRSLMQGSGLHITIGGKRFDYECFNHTFRMFASTRWEVRFDPEDMSRALAVNEDGSRTFMLEEKYVQPMALADRRPGDAEQLERIRRFNKEHEEMLANEICSHDETVRRLFGTKQLTPEEETLSKFLITDNRGQHKNRLNSKVAQLKEVKERAPVEEIFVMDDIYSDY